MTTILGIDNGTLGCLSFYDGTELMCYRMPVFEIDKRKHLNVQEIKKIILNDKPAHCFIEKTTPMPKISGLSAYSMGHSEGLFVGLLTALDVPFTLVRPAIWKKTMGCVADKDASRQRASQLLPEHAHNWDKKSLHDVAESALIALYGYKILR